MARRLRYAVAMSLDGYIAGPMGEADWITIDPEIDFGTMFAQFDTAVMGRRTFEQLAREGRASMPGMRTIVCSRTLRQEDHPNVTIWDTNQKDAIADLEATRGKDVWLFGGGTLFRSLAEAGLVDTVEVAMVPILLGSGVRVIAQSDNRIQLSLNSHRVYKTGLVTLEYLIRLLT